MYNNGIKRQIKNFKDVVRQGKKKKGKYFLGKTFSAKLFIKLCSKVVDTSIICMEILNFERENRTKEDIETVLPWIENLSYFYEYISMEETEESKKELLKQLIWLLYRKIFFKNTIIKRIDEINKYIYIILEGHLIKLELVIYREVLSLEEYLKYLIKMELLNEKEIIYKCKILNKSFIDINTESIKEFCDMHNDIYDYLSLKAQALKELIQFGMCFPKDKIENKNNQDYKIKSMDSYFKVFLFKSNPKISHDKSKAYFNFYLGKYVKNGIIQKGQYIGSFLREEVKDSSRYISKEKCIVAVFDKEKYYSKQLYTAYMEKMERIFSQMKKNFFIFHHISDDIFNKKYVPYMHYRKYVKGEKIFLQNSLHEGIYFLTKGTIKISLNISIDDMHNLMAYLKFSLNNFKEYVSDFNNEEFSHQNMKNSLYNVSKDIIELYSKKDNYDLLTIKDYDIIGTNETFDHKTEIYYFTAECTSDDAVLYFFPKFHLNVLLNKEKAVYNSFIQLVEFRIKDIVWKMKKYIKVFEREIKHQRFNSIKTLNNTMKKENTRNLIISRNKNNLLYNNDILTRNDFIKNKTSYKNKFLYNTKINLNERIAIKNIKKIFSENEKNREGFTERNLKIKQSNKINLFPLYTNKRKNIDEHNISRTQEKNGIKNIPIIFPYIIIDTLNKKEYIKDRNNNYNHLEHPIRTMHNLPSFKIKKLFINKNQW